MADRVAGTNTAGLEADRLADVLRECLAPVFVVVRPGQAPALTAPVRKLLGIADADLAVNASVLEPLVSLAREALKAKQVVSGRELTLKLPDGSRKSLLAGACPASEDGDGVVVIGLQDCFALKLLEQPLLQMDRLANVGILAASTVHEVKNALVPCRTFVDLLLEKNPDFELAGLVRRELKQMEELVNGLLSLSSAHPQNWGPVGVHQLLEDSIRLVQPQSTRRAVSVTRHFEAASDRIQGNTNQLQQAFVNLLLNALEALPEHGTITVGTAAVPSSGPQAELEIRVGDNGAGIASENLPRLFQPFFTTKPEGTGLGLTIVQRIVAGHRGRVTVTSEPGRGSVFTVSLPV